MGKLNYLTLDLFVYTLTEGLGQDQAQIREIYKQFWANLPTKIKESIDDVSLKLIATDPPEKTTLTFDGTLGNYAVDGKYYRRSLGDTDGLVFDCSVDGEVELQTVLPQLNNLAPIKPIEEAYLGQTWMISGWSNVGTESLANEVYKSLISKDWQHKQTGEFWGATLVELWRSPERWKQIEDNRHVIIIVYPNEQTMAQAANFYEDWLYLFSYQHKIIWAYNQARKLKNQLINKSAKNIPNLQNLLQQNLPQLKAYLQTNIETLSQYTRNINYLEIQQITIEVNIQKYERYLSHIASKNPEFKFLEEFSDIVTWKYKIQIEKDLANLRPVLSLLENVTNTIRGMVEIEQAKSDRHLENLVAAAGVGVGTASATASASSALVKDFTPFYPIKVDKNQLPFAEPLSNLLIVLLFSLGKGWLFGWLTWEHLRSPS